MWRRLEAGLAAGATRTHAGEDDAGRDGGAAGGTALPSRRHLRQARDEGAPVLPERGEPRCAYAVRAGDQHLYPGAGARSRPRPPPLNLASARDHVPQMLAQYARSADQAHFPAEVSRRDSRPTSLPPYLLESYSRIALAIPESEGYVCSSIVLHDTLLISCRSRSHDMTGYLQTSPQVDAFSVYSHTRTNSSDSEFTASSIAPESGLDADASSSLGEWAVTSANGD